MTNIQYTKFSFILSILLFQVLLLASGTVFSENDETAMITDLSGEVLIKQGDDSRKAELLAYISQGSRLQLKKQASLVLVFLEGGNEFHLKGPSWFEVQKTGLKHLSGKKPETRNVLDGNDIDLEHIKVNDLAYAGFTMRGLGNRKKLRANRLFATKTLETHPVFSWQGVRGANEYTFILKDAKGKTLFKQKTRSEEIALPRNINLKPESRYNWKVFTRVNNKKLATSGYFLVGKPETRRMIRKLLAKKARSFSDQVIKARLLDSYGYRDDAAKIWLSLSIQRPADWNLADEVKSHSKH